MRERVSALSEDRPIIGVRETVLVEEWDGDDPASGVRVIHEASAWFDTNGNKITDPDTIRRLEERSHGPDDSSS